MSYIVLNKGCDCCFFNNLKFINFHISFIRARALNELIFLMHILLCVDYMLGSENILIRLVLDEFQIFKHGLLVLFKIMYLWVMIPTLLFTIRLRISTFNSDNLIFNTSVLFQDYAHP